MQRTRACAALAASAALLATLAGCGRGETPPPRLARAGGAGSAPHAAAALPATPAPAAAAAAGASDRQAAIDGNVHRLGASRGTSVFDPDALIAEEVKAALVTRPEVGTPAEVVVSSRDGAVTLRGRVPDPQARERATEIARRIRNVRDVDNQLTVG
ncbi:BON domain-containing protein [Ramlibacter ginsenosidimutans]|uniref:BON domain-containing protein n=1 Tax=Ramlibacter ginsenosidimutans TaxID=502333 RepID=A0A934TWF7_9BURK|nr:BON domain-containing protein [Ramlibacter ginsenosidimutans]MBK6008595.1 BON domain-containing protein [Ramlibacter ginsenosidimutans]